MRFITANCLVCDFSQIYLDVINNIKNIYICTNDLLKYFHVRFKEIIIDQRIIMFEYDSS